MWQIFQPGRGSVPIFVRVKPTDVFNEMWGHFPDRCQARDRVQDNVSTFEPGNHWTSREIFQSWQQSERLLFEMLFQYL